MAGIRKQAIITSILVYIGVFFGALNTYLFVKEGNFGPEQYGLTRLFFDVGQNFTYSPTSVLFLLFTSFITTITTTLIIRKTTCSAGLLISLAGFVLVVIAAYFLNRLYSGSLVNVRPYSYSTIFGCFLFPLASWHSL